MHLGLGDATVVESLEIRWPSGRFDRRSGVAADQRIEIVGAG